MPILKAVSDLRGWVRVSVVEQMLIWWPPHSRASMSVYTELGKFTKTWAS